MLEAYPQKNIGRFTFKTIESLDCQAIHGNNPMLVICSNSTGFFSRVYDFATDSSFFSKALAISLYQKPLLTLS